MLDTPNTTLRARLRSETADDHARLDGRFGALALKEPSGLLAFLSAHMIGFRAVKDAAPDGLGHVKHAMLDEMCAALASDLVVLGGTTDLPMVNTAPVSKHAIDYIVLGSRLGTAVLRRDWAASVDPLVREASSYFNLSPRPDLWRSHCDDMGLIDGNTEEAKRVVTDARLLFDAFERSLDVIE